MSDDELRSKLEKIAPEVLASFLAQLAAEDAEIHERVEALALRSDPAAYGRALGQRLSRIKRGRRYIDYRESAAFARQLDAWLEDLEEGLVESDPEAAWKLLDAFIRMDGRILERVDDSSGNIGDVYRRACGLWPRVAAKLAPSPKWVDRIHDLFAGNDYGARDGLLDQAGALLTELELRRLAKIYEQEADAAGEQGAGFNYEALSATSAMGQVAVALGDAALYERSVRIRSPEPNALQGVEIGKCYLRFGPVEKAVEWLTRCKGDPRVLNCLELLAQAYEKLDDRARLLEARRELYEQTLSADKFRDYAALLPAEEREIALKQAIERAAGSDSPVEGAHLLLELAEPARAQAMLWRLRDELRNSFYSELIDLAKRLEKEGCELSAVLCYRALTDQILDQARSKAYRHAKRYVDRLASLDGRIGDYRGLPDHAGYLEQLREQHGRKRSFWQLFGG